MTGAGAGTFLAAHPCMGAVLHAVFDAAPDCILVTDPKGKIVMVNPQCEATFGYTVDELIGEPIEMLMPQALRAVHLAHVGAYIETPRVRHMSPGKRLQGLRKDGREICIEVALSSATMDGELHAIAIVRDVTRRVAEEERLRHLSTHDALTELYNRAFFEGEKARFERGRNGPVSVIVVDVDDLKSVNDEHGHEAGDQVLKRLATVLRGSFRTEDIVARLGGDEFCILLPGVDPERRDEAVRRLIADLDRHNDVYRGHAVEISIGGATAKRGAALPSAIRIADERMYAAKRRRRDRRESVL